MAGLGIGPGEFALFAIHDPAQRAEALEAGLAPALARIGDELVAGLSRIACARLLLYPGRPARRRGTAPSEVFVAFCASDKGYRAAPHLALAATRVQLHARVAARAAADPGGAMRRTLGREATNLARKGKPFRKLRSYSDWDHEELPEIVPAHSPAFWMEQAQALAPGGRAEGGIDLGVAWSMEEARNLAIGDVLGAFRDLAPLYKLLAGACAAVAAH
jgi:Protein of unknown function (DUF1054)